MHRSLFQVCYSFAIMTEEMTEEIREEMEDILEEGEITIEEQDTPIELVEQEPIEEPIEQVEEEAEAESIVEFSAGVNVFDVDYELGDGILCVSAAGEERPGLLIKASHNKGSALREVTVKWLLTAADWSRLTKKPEDVELEEVFLIFCTASLHVSLCRLIDHVWMLTDRVQWHRTN